MARFPDIPNEVVSRITSFTPKSDLSTLRQVNPSLRDHAEQSLYSTITLEWEDIDQLIPLLRTFLQRPELFTYVRTVSLDGGGSIGSEAPSIEPWQIPLDEFTSAIQETQVPFTNLWVDKLRAGSVDALVGLLIAHLSHTTKLRLHHIYADHFDIIGKVLQSKALGHHNLPRFQQLQEISYMKWAEYMNTDNHGLISTDSLSIFYLETLTSIKVWIFNPSIFRWPAGKPNLDHLTSLSIHWLRAPFVAEILALATNLKSLHWDWEFIPDTGDDWITPNLDLDEISKALSHVKHTLEKLEFNAFEGDYPDGYDGPDVSISGSLSGLLEFDRISDLTLPLVCLAGLGSTPLPLETCIPSTVETLSLTSYMLTDRSLAKWYPKSWQSLDVEIIKMIEAFAESSRTRLSRLQLVNIVETDDAYEGTDVHGKVNKLSLWFKTEWVYGG